MGLFNKGKKENKDVKMVCPNCKHEWTMSKFVYMTTPYAQRGVNQLFVCSKCGSHNIDYLTRIIGYLKRVSSFNEARQIEESMRSYTD